MGGGQIDPPSNFVRNAQKWSGKAPNGCKTSYSNSLSTLNHSLLGFGVVLGGLKSQIFKSKGYYYLMILEL